jgi:hypothetical protein
MYANPKNCLSREKVQGKVGKKLKLKLNRSCYVGMCDAAVRAKSNSSQAELPSFAKRDWLFGCCCRNCLPLDPICSSSVEASEHRPHGSVRSFSLHI